MFRTTSPIGGWRMNAERNRAVDDLAESEYHSLDLIEHIPIGLYRTTPDGRVLMANRALLKMLGCDSFAEVTAQDLEQDNNSLYPRPLFKERLERDGAIRGLEAAWRRRDGTTVFVREHARVVRGADGHVLYYEGTVEDITEYKRAEEELRESEERYRMVAETATDAILTIDERSTVLFMNAAATRIFGYTAEEVLGQSLTMLMPDYLRHVHKAAFGNYIATGQRHISWEAIELPGLHKSGHEIPLELSFGEFTQHGRRIFIGIARDVTERKRAQEALQRSAEYFRSLIEHSSDVISILNSDGVRRYVSPSVERVLGYKPEELVGQNAFALVHPDDVPGLAKLFAAGVKQPCFLITRELRYRHKDGSWRILEVTASNLLDNPVVAGIVINSRDITERKRAEEALLRTQARLRLINSISTAIRAGMSVAEIIANAVTQTQQYFSNFRVAYSTIDERNQLTLMHATQPPQMPAVKHLQIDLNTAPDYFHALRRGEVVAVADVTQDARLTPLLEAIHARGTYALLDVPLRHSDELIGLFSCGAPAPHVWTEHEIETVKEVAAHLSVVIREAHAEQERTRAEAARGELLAQLVTAQEEERRRIALELHDQLGQYVTALMLGLKALQDSGELAGANERLQQLLRLANQLGEEAHRLAWELRPSALDDLGLQGTLRNYLEEWALRFGRAVDFHSSGLRDRLPAQIESALYRIIQEALTNVAKHAQARHVSVILERRQGRVLAIVEDDGRGFDTVEVLESANTARRMGLVGMHERARLVGGELEIESAPGEGTTIYVRVPLTE
ncbi:MAG: PAS domain S-box protein [Pyrinomonadaceae bacterium]